MVISVLAESESLAPPELVAQAEEAVREFRSLCFWFWHPDALVRTMADIREVITELRRYGNPQAWLTAQEFQREVLAMIVGNRSEQSHFAGGLVEAALVRHGDEQGSRAFREDRDTGLHRYS